jgi:hypothetical protein
MSRRDGISFYDKMVELTEKVAPMEKIEIIKTVKLLKPIIDILNYTQRNDSTWEDFITKYRQLKEDPTAPAIIVKALNTCEKNTINCITQTQTQTPSVT